MYQDTINGLKQKTTDKIAKVDAAKTDLESDFSAMTTLETEVVNFGEDRYNAGFNDGVAQKGTPGDKIFSNEELDAEVKAATDPLKANVDSLTAANADLQGKVDAAAADKAAAIAGLKVEIAAKIEAVEVDNMALVAELKADAAPAPEAP